MIDCIVASFQTLKITHSNTFRAKFSKIDIIYKMNCELEAFLMNESGSEEDDDFQQILPEEDSPKNAVTEAIADFVHLQINNRLSNKATSNIIKLMNRNPTAAIKIPENTAQIKEYSVNGKDYIFFY